MTIVVEASRHGAREVAESLHLIEKQETKTAN